MSFSYIYAVNHALKMDEIEHIDLLDEGKVTFFLHKHVNSPHFNEIKKKVKEHRKVQKDEFLKRYDKMNDLQKQSPEVKQKHDQIIKENEKKKPLKHDEKESHQQEAPHDHRTGPDYSFLHDGSKSLNSLKFQRPSQLTTSRNHGLFAHSDAPESWQESSVRFMQFPNSFETQQDHSLLPKAHNHDHENEVKRLQQKIQDFRDKEHKINELREQKAKIEAELEHLIREHIHKKSSALRAQEELKKLKSDSHGPNIERDLMDDLHNLGAWIIGKRPGYTSSNFQDFHDFNHSHNVHGFHDFYHCNNGHNVQGLGRRIW